MKPLQKFTCTILSQCPEYALEMAISLPGWSHASSEGWEKIQTSWYPFETYARKIYFHAKNRTAAVKQCTRAGLEIRDLC